MGRDAEMNNSLGSMDMREIMAVIPHRPPFLFVDRVLEHVPGSHIQGVKRVSSSPDDRALFSPLVVIESIAQVAVILASKSMAAERREGDLFFFAGIQGARIEGAVAEGDVITLEARLERIRRGIGWFHGSAAVGGRRIVDVMMQAAFRSSAVPNV
jgi:3-hydroxyacyl-[acyl-carrier-protein] dehydratase